MMSVISDWHCSQGEFSLYSIFKKNPVPYTGNCIFFFSVLNLDMHIYMHIIIYLHNVCF